MIGSDGGWTWCALIADAVTAAAAAAVVAVTEDDFFSVSISLWTRENRNREWITKKQRVVIVVNKSNEDVNYYDRGENPAYPAAVGMSCFSRIFIHT